MKCPEIVKEALNYSPAGLLKTTGRIGRSLGDSVMKRNVIRKNLDVARKAFHRQRQVVKANDVFSSWGRKTYKGKGNWDPKLLLGKLKRSKAKMKGLQRDYTTIGRNLTRYQHPQQVASDLSSIIR